MTQAYESPDRLAELPPSLPWLCWQRAGPHGEGMQGWAGRRAAPTLHSLLHA